MHLGIAAEKELVILLRVHVDGPERGNFALQGIDVVVGLRDVVIFVAHVLRALVREAVRLVDALFHVFERGFRLADLELASVPFLVLLLLFFEEGALALRTCFLFGALFALFLLRTGNVGADGVDGGAVFVGKCHFFRLLFKNGKFGRGALRLLAVGSDAGEQRFALVLKALGIFFLRRAGGKKGSALFAEGGDLFVELIALLPEFPALLLAGGGFGGSFRADAV